jgi:predicted dehydrogenase
LINQGEFGEILSVNAGMFMPHNYQRPDTLWAARRDAGNHLLSIQVGHILDMLESCLGALTVSRAEVGTRVTPWRIEGHPPIDADAPDHVAILGRFLSGGEATLHFAYVPRLASGWRLEIFGSEGAARITASGVGHVAPVRLELGVRGATALEPTDVPACYCLVPDAIPRGAAFQVAHLYRAFAQAIVDGRRAAPSFADGLFRLESLAEIERFGNTAISASDRASQT